MSDQPPAAPGDRVQALSTYPKPRETTRDKFELAYFKNDVFTIISIEGPFWLIVRDRNGKRGHVATQNMRVIQRVEARNAYNKWKITTNAALAAGNLTTFPNIPENVIACSLTACANEKSTPGTLGACKHDVERLLKGNPNYNLASLRKESHSWHPDRFRNRCNPEFREELGKQAEELFKIIGILIGKGTVDEEKASKKEKEAKANAEKKEEQETQATDPAEDEDYGGVPLYN